MKKIFFVLAISLAGCSTPKEYIYDPRASKHPQEIIRDKLECREIIKPILATKNELTLGFIPICSTKQCMKWSDPFYDPMQKCLEKRGHSILN